MDFSAVTPLHVHSYMQAAPMGEMSAVNALTQPASGNWPLANDAILIPIYLPWAYQVQRFFWINGATVTGNIDVGVYSLDFERIASCGSTAQSGASAMQYVNATTAVLLMPGAYYLAMACSGTTGLVWTSAGVSGTTAQYRMCGMLRQATALALPTTITPVAASSTCYPFCGFTKTTTGF